MELSPFDHTGPLPPELVRGRDDLLADLVDTLVRAALRRPTITIFDEFQQIATVAGGTAVLRAALQHHDTDIGLLFAGSEPSAMRGIVSDHAQPFLHQAQLVEFGPLDLPATRCIVNDGFTTTGRTPGAVASLIHQFTRGHPLRTMQAAHAAWLHTTHVPADTTWGAALAHIRKTARPGVAAVYEQLPATDPFLADWLTQTHPL